MEHWTPNYIIRRELHNISQQTTCALKTLLALYAPQESGEPINQQIPLSIQEMRTEMAQTHARMVGILDAAVGHEKAVELGRKALFEVGVNLGKQTRTRLGVSDSPKDLIKAAKILYRILGIEFHMGRFDDTHAEAIIDQCALARKYSGLTCQVLSATDEGVIKGLQPNADMQFKEYMTNGGSSCRAHIQFTRREAEA